MHTRIRTYGRTGLTQLHRCNNFDQGCFPASVLGLHFFLSLIKDILAWFECDAARRIASIKSEFDFWTILSHYDDAKNVSSFAQKLLTCYSSIRNVEKDATNLLLDIGHSTSTERWHHKRSILCNFNCRDQEERNGAKFQKRRANRDECFPSSTCMQ